MATGIPKVMIEVCKMRFYQWDRANVRHVDIQIINTIHLLFRLITDAVTRFIVDPPTREHQKTLAGPPK